MIEAERRIRGAMARREATSGWATVTVPDLTALLAELDRLTRERDELVDEVALKVACINGMSQTADKLAAERDALAKALEIAECALADIGDADREPGDDLAWCEQRAAEALPKVRAALAAREQPK